MLSSLVGYIMDVQPGSFATIGINSRFSKSGAKIFRSQRFQIWSSSKFSNLVFSTSLSWIVL